MLKSANKVVCRTAPVSIAVKNLHIQMKSFYFVTMYNEKCYSDLLYFIEKSQKNFLDYVDFWPRL